MIASPLILKHLKESRHRKVFSQGSVRLTSTMMASWQIKHFEVNITYGSHFTYIIKLVKNLMLIYTAIQKPGIDLLYFAETISNAKCNTATQCHYENTHLRHKDTWYKFILVHVSLARVNLKKGIYGLCPLDWFSHHDALTCKHTVGTVLLTFPTQPKSN
jgi:hypothetical protein